MNAHDRCDSCGAPALIKVEKVDTDLIFCLHHYAKLKAALTAQGFAPATEEELAPA